MLSARWGLDYILNRYAGIYQGLSPKSPKRFNIPSFVEVENNIESIVQLTETELRKKFKLFKFRKPLVVSGERTWEVAGKRIYEDISESKSLVDYTIIKSNSISEVERIVKEGTRRLSLGEIADSSSLSEYDTMHSNITCGLKRHNLIYAVGGGSVIDVAKMAAHNLNIPWISVPTTLSNDGFASQFAVINLGEKGVHTLTANVPLGVIVDTNLIKSNDVSYERRIRSGIGDLLSNITAVLDWELADDLPEDDSRHERIDHIERAWAVSGAESIIRIIGENKAIVYDNGFIQDLAVYLIMSAEAMGRHGSSRPASGFEHKMYHMYNQITQYQPKATHGEIVAVGTLLSSYAHEKHYDELQCAFGKIGLPTSERDLGEIGIQKDDVKQAIAMSSDFRKGRYTILDEKGSDYLIDCVDKVFR